MAFHVVMGVPKAVAAAGVANLNEADTVLGEPAREQKLAAEVIGLFHANSVQIQDVLRLGGKIHNLGGLQHHATGQFEGPGAGGDFALNRVVHTELLVQFEKGEGFFFTLFGGGRRGRNQIRDWRIAGLERALRNNWRPNSRPSTEPETRACRC